MKTFHSLTTRIKVRRIEKAVRFSDIGEVSDRLRELRDHQVPEREIERLQRLFWRRLDVSYIP